MQRKDSVGVIGGRSGSDALRHINLLLEKLRIAITEQYYGCVAEFHKS